MIKKIKLIKNIGKFRSYSESGDMTFQKLTLIYAANAQGKTTLASVFRSLATGDPEHVQVRKRDKLSSDEPEVIIKLDTGNSLLKNNSWSRVVSNMEIFDSHFINNNVFSGYQVEHEHKKNLCYFVLGEDGKNLVTDSDKSSADFKEIGQQKKQKEAEIQRTITSDLSILDFVQSVSDPQIDTKILEKQKEIKTLQQAEKITQTALLENLVLPIPPIDKCRQLLQQSINGISQQAEDKTRQHIKTHMDENGENWIRTGLSYATDEQCPFCGQIISASDVFSAYKDYFNSAYTSLKKSIEEIAVETESVFSNNTLLAIQKTITSNERNGAFWLEYIQTEYPSISFVEIQSAIEIIRSLLQEHISKKALAPLEIIEFNQALQNAIIAYQQVLSKVEKYNVLGNQANHLISDKKKEVQSDKLNIKLNAATIELKRLADIKRRHEDSSIQSLCQEYQNSVVLARNMELQKKTSKEKLDSYAESVFSAYQSATNTYLELFGVDFQIVNTKTRYSGASASTDYGIQLFNNLIDLASLSEGDKSTLAFAFFIAKLERDPEIIKKIIVIDDPIASLDIHRKTRTYQHIAKLQEKALQVIVLSHNADFLRSLWKNTSPNSRKALKITPFDNASSKIEEWDTERETRSEYFESFFQLEDFMKSGNAPDLRAVARCIRPVLEGYYRVRFPREFPESFWLQDFCKRIGDPNFKELDVLLPIKAEIDDIKDYSNKYHHAENPAADSEPITHATLKSYVKQTLNILRK
jgi:wobble nucleotide-excising tRNase